MPKPYSTEVWIANTGGSMENLNLNQKVIAWLNSARGISNRKIEKLIEYFDGSTKNLWDNFESEKNNLTILKPEIIAFLIKTKCSFEEKFIKRLNQENASIITIFDNAYPKKLKQCSGAPYILYYKGSIEKIDDFSIAVVGSRKATAYGKWAAEKFTKDLAELEVNIISGLAAGIDAVAHKTALKSNTNTFGVIGCGIDKIYPMSNERLYSEISEKGGAVITEYPFGMQPLPNNFYGRNRIISGLSDGVLVIEAQTKSGTLITAGHAANQGREVFAIPGNINSLYSKGTNALIKDGAKITVSVYDILEEFPKLKEKLKKKNKFVDCIHFRNEEKKIIECIKQGTENLYEINTKTGIEAGKLLSFMTVLEMKGAVKQIQGSKFVLNI